MSYLTTKKAADILGVSPTTIRRYSDTGVLPVIRLTPSGHRRFTIVDVNKLHDNSVKEGEMNLSKRKRGPAIAKPHPRHYLMHKYWGRKAHNIVENYLKEFTKEGDVIFDPFMGSGVVLIEAAKLNRSAIGIDINPLSKFIVDVTSKKINLKKLVEKYEDIELGLNKKFAYYNKTKCSTCGLKSVIETTIWNKTKPEILRFRCPTHGTGIKPLSLSDKKIIKETESLFKKLNKAHALEYPTDKIFDYVRRSGVLSINELYTPRALIELSYLYKQIERVKDISIKDTLKLMFSSMLPNVSNMIPGDLEKGTYKSGWVISKFWVPTIHTERSVLHCMRLRFDSIVKGKEELANLNSDLICTYTADSKRTTLGTNSVDYIFTDPPYGESIAYLALSHFYNSWLKMKPRYLEEIIIDSYRGISTEDFTRNIQVSFAEMFRVLKPNKYLSFTFHNRDLKVWKAILEGCLKSGFELKEIVLQPQAVSSGTQGINKRNTLHGDFIYTFQKPRKAKKHNGFKYLNNAHSFLVNKINSFLLLNGGSSSAELYKYIIPIIVRNHAYVDGDGSVIDLENLVTSNFEYKETKEGYRWNVRGKPRNESRYTVVDLFAGAGGFSEGFRRAGFDVAIAVENDQRHRETYTYNHPKTRLIIDGVENISRVSKKKGAFSIAKFLSGTGKTCNVIIGGPPCQGFSMAGLRIRKNKKFFADKRNYLFQEYLGLVKSLKPEVFVLENVAGILNFNNGIIKKEILSRFEEIGYNVHAEILNASDYGVPQFRKRAIFIGNRLGIMSKALFPDPKKHRKFVSVWDAIGDLPQINSGSGAQVLDNTMGTPMSMYQEILRLENEDCIYNHQAPTHSEATLDIMKLVKPGQGMKDLPKRFHTKSVHSGAYGRMEKDKPSYTLTTRLNTPSVGKITHPVLDRTITPREAARLQSFSDSFRFFGNATTQGIQIGNAVPPLLAELIAVEIRQKCLDQFN